MCCVLNVSSLMHCEKLWKKEGGSGFGLVRRCIVVSDK